MKHLISMVNLRQTFRQPSSPLERVIYFKASRLDLHEFFKKRVSLLICKSGTVCGMSLSLMIVCLKLHNLWIKFLIFY